ncbi:MAG: AAA family ATPase [bacterium]|nr:AAA family ATPase [bacterium]
MIGKVCAPPSKGSTASGLIEYLVGYAISEKGATRQEIADALDAVYIECEDRADLGVGAVWSPEAGGGIRPSSILVRNCAAFSTASLEIDADAARNPGVRSSAIHFVWSWSEEETKAFSDEQVHEYVGEVLEKLGLREHRSVAVVHRDTDNLHVHCAVGSVNPGTGLAYDRTGLHRRMAWAEREVELAHGLSHDRGLAVVQDAGLDTAHVRWADKYELAAWRAERREERLIRQERRSFEGYRARDTSFERYVDATVAPRLVTAMALEQQRGDEPSWATLHAVAARYGCTIERRDDGEIVIRDVGIGESRVAHEQYRRELRDELAARGADPDEIEARLADVRARHTVEEAQERDQKLTSGDTVAVSGTLRARLSGLPEYQDADQAEAFAIERVAADPNRVLKAVTAQSSTFMREDVDQYLAARIADPDEIERLGDLIVRGPSVRVLSADPIQPLMTTTEILGIEDQLRDDAAALATTASRISEADIVEAIHLYEAEQEAQRDQPFRLSSEQREALLRIASGSLVVIEGLPGVGKTTIQGAVRVLGGLTGREVVGLTLSQAAAERLESEAGFHCVNTARARILEEGNQTVIPHGGIVVVDEAAMVDSRANGKILALARERGSIVLEIGDVRQLQPIDFGASFRILREVAREAGTHAELRDIQRQQRPWHRDAVAELADAIAAPDEQARYAKVRAALEILEAHGALSWTEDRDAAIDEAVRLSAIRRKEGHDTLTLASDRDSVRHLSEEDRRGSGLDGMGRRFQTASGAREFATGDRLMFLENNYGKGGFTVRNGDRGTVTELLPDRITVELDGVQPRTVAFSPLVYQGFDYANACTVHKAQGASVDAAVALIDRSASAELLFVAVSRSKQDLDVVIPRSAFRDIDDLARHVSENISLKTTTQTYDEILERTGGDKTIRVRNIESQREAIPMRRLYEAEVAEPLRALNAERVEQVRETYRQRKDEIAVSDMSMEDRLEAGKDALRVMRSSILGIYREHKPQPFVEWLEEWQEQRERVRPTVNRGETQEQSVDREREVGGEFSRAEEASQSSGLQHER